VGLKLVHQGGCSSISHINSTSSKTLITSYAISNLIAEHSKSFTKDQFVKEFLIAAVQSFRESFILQEAASIPSSVNIVKSRTNCIASSFQEKLKSLSKSCSYFPLCLDESTNNRHVSQLSIFARIVQSDFSYVDEFF